MWSSAEKPHPPHCHPGNIRNSTPKPNDAPCLEPATPRPPGCMPSEATKGSQAAMVSPRMMRQMQRGDASTRSCLLFAAALSNVVFTCCIPRSSCKPRPHPKECQAYYICFHPGLRACRWGSRRLQHTPCSASCMAATIPVHCRPTRMEPMQRATTGYSKVDPDNITSERGCAGQTHLRTRLVVVLEAPAGLLGAPQHSTKERQ